MAHHLVISLSSHGFGHIGQTAPVITALRKILPDIKITIRSSAPAFKLHEKFGADLYLENAVTDIGMLQADALNVDIMGSAEAYKEFHKNWTDRVNEETNALLRLKPDLVLSNVSYLALMSAKRAGVESIAMCSLNWADIYEYFFVDRVPEFNTVYQEIFEAYATVTCFIRPTPSMPMPSIKNTLSIGPIAQLGLNRRSQINEKLALSKKTKLVLVSLGGMDIEIPSTDWPRLHGLKLIVPKSWGCTHPDTFPLEDLHMSFSDVLISSDVLIAKPGYGSFTEAACAAIPVLYLKRNNWPEAPYLLEWLKNNAACRELELQDIVNARLPRIIEDMCLKQFPSVEPTGNMAAARIISSILEKGNSQATKIQN